VKGRRVPHIEIYTKTFCSFCWRAKELLDRKGARYREIGIDRGGPERDAMIERANGRSTVPQIFIAGKHIGGCDDLFTLERNGKLDELLAA
jgi:glutaredoxin 3